MQKTLTIQKYDIPGIGSNLWAKQQEGTSIKQDIQQQTEEAPEALEICRMPRKKKVDMSKVNL